MLVDTPEDWATGQTVTMTEIAEFAEVRRPTVSNWRRRHPDFPKPVRDDGQSALFDAAAIARWLDRRTLPAALLADAGVDIDQPMTYGEVFRRGLALRALGAFRNTLDGDRLLAVGLALTALRVLTGEPLALDNLARGIRRVADAGRGVDASALTRSLRELPDGAETLLGVVNALVDSVGGARAVERLLDQADRLGSGSRQEATPAAVAEMIARLAGPLSDRTLLDPAAGLGSLLLQVAEVVRPKGVIAADVDEQKTDSLRFRLLCHGLSSVVRRVDVLTGDASAVADIVVLDPPFTPLDRRNDGLPLAVELARWADVAVRLLRPGGTAFLLVPLPALRGVGGRVATRRHPLAADGTLQAVIQLPRRIHTFRVGVEFALLVYGNSSSGSDGFGEVVFCDADRYATSGTNDWIAQVGRWIQDPDTAPAAFVCWGQATGTLVPAERLTAHRPSTFEFARLHETQSAMHGFEPGLADLSVQWEEREYRTLGELYTVLPGHKVDGRRVRTEDPTGLVILGSPELTGNASVGSRSIGIFDVGESVKVTDAGDVVVLAGDEIRAIVDETGGSVVVSPAQVVRIRGFADYQAGRSTERPDMSPRVLAALLTAPRNAGRATGSLARRVDLTRLELPRLDPEEIVRLDQALAAIEASRRRVAHHLAAIDAFHATLVAGVADGVLRVVVDGGNEEGQ